MSWKIFRNQRAELLEQQLIDERNDNHARILLILKLQSERNTERQALEERLMESHRLHVGSLELMHSIMEHESMRERVELKKAHADELNRVIEENQKLRDDNERLRLLVTPALQTVELPKERSAPPPPSSEVFTGTPWQRVLQREIAAQDRAAAARHTKPADAPLEGESHGSSSEGRNPAPLSGESKSA
jgi:hypothetical protein